VINYLLHFENTIKILEVNKIKKLEVINYLLHFENTIKILGENTIKILEE